MCSNACRGAVVRGAVDLKAINEDTGRRNAEAWRRVSDGRVEFIGGWTAADLRAANEESARLVREAFGRLVGLGSR